MMTIGAASEEFSVGKSEPELKSRHQKRVTPFSIDDILAHKTAKASPDYETLRNIDVASFKAVKQHFYNKRCCESTLAWSYHAYANWFNNMNFYNIRSFQPFLFSHLLQERVQASTCYRVSDENFRCLSVERPRSENPCSVVLSTGSNLSPEKYSRKRRISDTESLPTENEIKSVKNSKLDVEWNNVKEQGSCSSATDSEDGQHLDGSDHSVNTDSNSPLSALERWTCSTFKSMEKKQHKLLHAITSVSENVKAKRRKCRTAFTSFQLSILEQRFKYHKYLTPADRDQISRLLGLTAPQVITWFQNRRAKQKRDLEEMKNDLKAVEKNMNNCTPQILSTSLIGTRAGDGRLKRDRI